MLVEDKQIYENIIASFSPKLKYSLVYKPTGPIPGYQPIGLLVWACLGYFFLYFFVFFCHTRCTSRTSVSKYSLYFQWYSVCRAHDIRQKEFFFLVSKVTRNNLVKVSQSSSSHHVSRRISGDQSQPGSITFLFLDPLRGREGPMISACARLGGWVVNAISRNCLVSFFWYFAWS